MLPPLRWHHPLAVPRLAEPSAIFFALTAKKHEADRLRFMVCKHRFIISMIASYGFSRASFSPVDEALFRISFTIWSSFTSFCNEALASRVWVCSAITNLLSDTLLRDRFCYLSQVSQWRVVSSPILDTVHKSLIINKVFSSLSGHYEISVNAVHYVVRNGIYSFLRGSLRELFEREGGSSSARCSASHWYWELWRWSTARTQHHQRRLDFHHQKLWSPRKRVPNNDCLN